jgi:uncharacterized protein (TIGR02453 family)
MIQNHTLQFLSNIAENNNRDWFLANKTAYEKAKTNIIEVTEQLIASVGQFDAMIDLANIAPKDCMTRINRDVRFSANKDPYKTNFSVMLNADGKKSLLPYYYLSVAPSNTFLGVGVYMPMPPELKKFRQEIHYNFEEWQAITTEKTFMDCFPKGVESPESLSRPPQGFDADSPAIAYLKMKGYCALKYFTDDEVQSSDFVTNVSKHFKAGKPINDFLAKALD